MVVYPVMGQPSCYPTTQATPPPLNIASSAVSIFKRWMNQTANNIYCKAMLAQWHICQTSYFIMKDFLQTPPHTSPSDRPLWKPSALWPASQHNSHTVFGAPRRPLGGGGVQLSSHTVSAQAFAVRRGDRRNRTRASITAPAQEPCSIMAFT